MIAETIKILISDKFYGVSKTIEIAKGKHERVTNVKDGIEKIKRSWQSRKL